MGTYNGIGYYGKDFFVIKSDYDLVSESITRILMTNPTERVGQPYFGAGLKNQVFEILDDAVASTIDSSIREQITAYEPRVNITTMQLTPNPSENNIAIKIGFTLLGDTINDERFINIVYQLAPPSS
jgi:phage baseplate assembly protein W